MSELESQLRSHDQPSRSSSSLHTDNESATRAASPTRTPSFSALERPRRANSPAPQRNAKLPRSQSAFTPNKAAPASPPMGPIKTAHPPQESKAPQQVPQKPTPVHPPPADRINTPTPQNQIKPKPVTGHVHTTQPSKPLDHYKPKHDTRPSAHLYPQPSAQLSPQPSAHFSQQLSAHASQHASPQPSTEPLAEPPSEPTSEKEPPAEPTPKPRSQDDPASGLVRRARPKLVLKKRPPTASVLGSSNAPQETAAVPPASRQDPVATNVVRPPEAIKEVKKKLRDVVSESSPNEKVIVPEPAKTAPTFPPTNTLPQVLLQSPLTTTWSLPSKASTAKEG